MPARNALTRLVGVAPNVESLVDAVEEEQILARILASPRAIRRPAPWLRAALVLAGAAVVAAAIALVSTGAFTGSSRHVALKGAKLDFAGYHFRTPAGYKASSSSCTPNASGNGFAAAASADGGCVEMTVMISMNGSAVPAGAEPVDVGAYQGYLVSSDGSQQTRLYVVLPSLGNVWQALVLLTDSLTPQQLVAVAESGLPPDPAAASTIGPT